VAWALRFSVVRPRSERSPIEVYGERQSMGEAPDIPGGNRDRNRYGLAAGEFWAASRRRRGGVLSVRQCSGFDNIRAVRNFYWRLLHRSDHRRWESTTSTASEPYLRADCLARPADGGLQWCDIAVGVSTLRCAVIFGISCCSLASNVVPLSSAIPAYCARVLEGAWWPYRTRENWCIRL